jgi:AcrR family transcriptional regulator
MKSVKEKIIHESLKQLLVSEPGELSLRAVSKKVGVSPMAVYRHFESKGHLLACLAHEGFDTMTGEMEAAARLHPYDPMMQLEELGIAYIKMAVAKPAHLKVMFGTSEVNYDEHPELKQSAEKSFQLLVDCIVRTQLAKAVPAGDPVKLAIAVWSAVHGFSMLIIQKQLEWLEVDLKNFEAHARSVAQMAARGITK